MFDGSGGTKQSTLAPVKPTVTTLSSARDGLRVVTEPRHRRDIDGLRAIAVTLVVLFHAGVPFLPGGFVGVDVFFVISGFLISGMLLREVTDTNRISLRVFYARRIRRLLPLATLVLVTTVILSFLLLPLAQRGSTGTDINSAALFFSNWHFASVASDYWAGGIDKSPVLHFWSLSVEEQYYMVWPMLMLLFVRRRRRTESGLSAKIRMAVLVAIVGGGSLALSILTTSDNPSWAYFGLHTRAWELAAGAAVGIAAVSLRKLPRILARCLMWIGLTLIFASAVLINSTIPYPGSAALLPVGATVLVIAGGCALAAKDQPRLLTGGVAQYVGRTSYSWYLWHWPALVFVALVVGASSENAVAGSPVGGVPILIVTGAVVGSFVIAALSSRLVEQPMRRSAFLSLRPRRSLLFGGLAILTVVLASTFALIRPEATIALAPTPDVAKSATGVSTAVIPGGQRLFLSQDPRAAKDDKIDLPDGCVYTKNVPVPLLKDCNIGDPKGARTVVLVGDSKARVWAAGFGNAAKENGWKLYTATMPGCPFMQVKWQNPKSPGCDQFREELTKQIATMRDLDLVLVARDGSTYARSAGTVSDVRGMWADATAQTVRGLGSAAAKTVVLRDAPTAPQDVPDCLIGSWEDPQACSWERRSSDDEMTRAERDGALAAGISLRTLDLTSLICPTETCHAVDRNGTITYRDTNHLTARFSLSLWKAIGQRVDELF